MEMWSKSWERLDDLGGPRRALVEAVRPAAKPSEVAPDCTSFCLSSLVPRWAVLTGSFPCTSAASKSCPVFVSWSQLPKTLL